MIIIILRKSQGIITYGVQCTYVGDNYVRLVLSTDSQLSAHPRRKYTSTPI